MNPSNKIAESVLLPIQYSLPEKGTFSEEHHNRPDYCFSHHTDSPQSYQKIMEELVLMRKYSQ